jgi:hypothetical protein
MAHYHSVTMIVPLVGLLGSQPLSAAMRCNARRLQCKELQDTQIAKAATVTVVLKADCRTVA